VTTSPMCDVHITLEQGRTSAPVSANWTMADKNLGEFLETPAGVEDATAAASTQSLRSLGRNQISGLSTSAGSTPS
jgi:hypothetical protein